MSTNSQARPADGRLARLAGVNPIRRLLFGRPIPTAHQEHTRLPKLVALPVFASDAISSAVYATQEILLVLGASGLWLMAHRELYNRLTWGITLGIVALLGIVVVSYWQTIFAYPSGGGSYIVSKENLGIKAGMVAGSALLIDYVLTVGVSIASASQNLLATPVMAPYADHIVGISVLFIALIAWANLRGLKESGTVFAIPTYVFIVMAGVMIVLGLFGPSVFGWTIDPGAVEQTLPEQAYKAAGQMSLFAMLPLVMRAFASGCAAMTGTEAVSNGIPAFQRPESRNAALTLVAMAIILGGLFIGISALAMKLHVVYGHWGHNETSPAVIDQLAAAVFGKSGHPIRVALYYTMQFSTVLILVFAANTAFADFPRLANILARDRFLPKQLSNQGDKLVYSNGIVFLGLASAAVTVAFHGSVDRLIPLYAVGVFTAFTLSQSGMVVHWFRSRARGWSIKALINGFGALCTGIVLLVIAVGKWSAGAWLVIIVAALVIAVFIGIRRHYQFVRSRLSLTGGIQMSADYNNRVIVLIPGLHRGVLPALDFARSITAEPIGVHIEIDPDETPRLRRDWERYVGEDFPLLILESPYRSLIGPLLQYLDASQAAQPDSTLTVVVPEFTSNRWWHSLLHNSSGLLVKLYLLNRPGVIVTNVRYFLDTAPVSRFRSSRYRP